jgi:hypothetical protein
VPGFFQTPAYATALMEAITDFQERARFAAKTATSRAQQEEAERQRTLYADQAVSAKYRLRHLRRDLREDGATPPRMPPALGDVDLLESDPDTPEERL